MGLDELGPFKPEKRVIEYLLADPAQSKLVNKTLAAFAEETASESPAPVAARSLPIMGSLGPHWLRWWPIYHHIKRMGRTLGRIQPVGGKRRTLPVFPPQDG